MNRLHLIAVVWIGILVLATNSAHAADFTFGTSVEVSNNHSTFNLSVFPGKAGYSDGVDSGVFGDGTVLDYRFFDTQGTENGEVFTEAGYANGEAGLVGNATATHSSGLNGGALHWADVWTTSDPGTNYTDGDPANFTRDTFARAQGIEGAIDISELSEGNLYFIHGSYHNPWTISLTMTGAGQADVTFAHTEDPPNTVNMAWISSFDFSDAGAYDTLTWEYTNTDTDGSRARFMGVILAGDIEQGIPGDINQDDVIDRADAATFVPHYGKQGDSKFGTGDFDKDNDTTLSDLALMQSHFGEVNEGGAPAAVPEPSSLVLLSLAAVTWIGFHRRRTG